MKMRIAMNFMRSAKEPAMIAHLPAARQGEQSRPRPEAPHANSSRLSPRPAQAKGPEQKGLATLSRQRETVRDDGEGELEHAKDRLGDGPSPTPRHDRLAWARQVR